MAADMELYLEDIKNDFIKMEIDLDGAEDWPFEEFPVDEDPILMLKPIVYTTKLDDMHTMKSNLKELNAKEIIEKLYAESKPKLLLQTSIKASKSKNIDSYIKLLDIVKRLNCKAGHKRQSAKTSISNLLNQCKTCSIVLKDTKIFPSCNNKTPETIEPSNCTEAVPSVKKAKSVESVRRNIKPGSQIKKGLIGASKKSIIQTRTEDIHLTDRDYRIHENGFASGEKSQAHSSVVTGASNKTNEIIEPSNCSTKTAASVKKAKTVDSVCLNIKPRPLSKKAKIKISPGTSNPESSDDDDLSLINYKKKPNSQPLIPEKYALMVLLYNKEAHVYRINHIKLVTDYYVTKDYDEYEIAAMYPKDEKNIENYCCWFKREEIITKMCAKKSYSFAIQKFLRQPHRCSPGFCQCCCSFKNISKSIAETQKQKTNVNESPATADNMISGLLNRKKPAKPSLISKAMSYIPKTRVKDKPIVVEPEKYLESVLLLLKYTGSQDHIRNILELYEIGKNGDVVSSHILNEPQKGYMIINTYTSIGFQTMEATYCCWYMREKIMLNLRTAKLSPSARKLIKMQHSCMKNKCTCCCKPQNMPLERVEILPPTFKHSTSYEKNAHLLKIRFNVGSRYLNKTISKEQSQPKSTANQKISPILPDSKRTPAITESTPTVTENAHIEDLQDVNNMIQSEFKNLIQDFYNGKQKAVLTEPAKKLTIVPTQHLCNILSNKHTAEFGISTKEFGRRKNAQTAHSNYDVANDLPEIRESTSPSPQIENQKTTENKIVSKPTTITTKPAETISPRSTSPKIMPAFTSKPLKSKFASNMYASISNLMETKNKMFVDSFNSFFQHSDDSTASASIVVIPTANTILPTIAHTFTLTKSVTKNGNKKIPKPSGKKRARRPKITSTLGLSEKTSIVSSESDLSNNLNKDTLQTPGPSTYKTHMQPGSTSTEEFLRTALDNEDHMQVINGTKYYSRTKIVKRKRPDDRSAIGSKIRVITPSELMSTDTAQTLLDTVTVDPQLDLSQNWPGPIIIKKDPQTKIQTIVRPANPTSIQINPSLQTKAYNLDNNVSASNITIINNSTANNICHINGNDLTPASDNLNQNKNMCYLSLTPLTVPSPNGITDKSIHTQILKPLPLQATVISEHRLPPIVPIRYTEVSKRGSQSVIQSRDVRNFSNTIPAPTVAIKDEITD